MGAGDLIPCSPVFDKIQKAYAMAGHAKCGMFGHCVRLLCFVYERRTLE